MLALWSLSESKDLHIQIHLSENVDEIELVRKIYPHCVSYTDVYYQHNILIPRTILTHSIHISPTKRKLIIEKQAKVSHCPVSNSVLASSKCPAGQLL